MKPPLQRIEEFLNGYYDCGEFDCYGCKAADSHIEKLEAALKEAVNGLRFMLKEEDANYWMRHVADILDGGEK